MNWTQKCYSRMIVDNHITDFKPEFMSKMRSILMTAA